MKITQIRKSRAVTVNMGNYQSTKIEVEYTIEPEDGQREKSDALLDDLLKSELSKQLKNLGVDPFSFGLD